MNTAYLVGINRSIVGKCSPHQLSHPGAWKPQRVTLPKLADHIRAGHPWMPSTLDGNGQRWQSNANHAEVLGLDIDEGMTIQRAIAHPVIAAHCGLLIESASSTPQHNKFRLVFALPQPVEGWETIRLCNRYLAHVVGSADPACKDASRFFFGAPGRSPHLLQAVTLPSSFVQDAIAWGEALEAEERQRAEIARQQWEALKAQGADTDALLLEALDHIPPNCDYNDWIAVGMALAGMGDGWFHAWDSWSAGAANYNPREMQGRWKSFRGASPAPGVVLGIAKRYGWRAPKRARRIITTSAATDTKATATDTKQARRLQVAQQAMGILNAALPTADTATVGGYMPPLPPIKAGFSGYAIDAPMGAGKTTRIGLDVVAANRAAGGFTLELSPRNSLGQQAAAAHGLPHIHHYGTDRESNRLLGVDSRDRGGMVLCPPSLERAAQHIPENRPLHIVIDEAMATMTEALEGGTLKKKWSKTMDLMISLLQRAATVTISESNLDAATVALVEALSGKRLQMIRHRRNAAPWPVSLHAGGSPNGWRAEVAGRLLAGDRVWLTATSVDELRRWELWAKDHGITTLLICGETNDAGRFDDLFTSPDDSLSQRKPQLFLSNQSVQTGLSVEGDHFDLVAGYGPGFPAEVLYQQLGRYRRPVPRLVWMPDYIPPNRWEKPQRGSVLAEMGHEVAAWAGKGFQSKDPHQAAIDGYLAARWQGRWAQKMVPGAAMARLLGRAGHSVAVTRGEANIPFQHQWQELTEALARQRSEFHAGLSLDECHDLDWAHRILEDGESTHEDRCRARKLMTAARFPGVDWDSADIWYHAVFCPSANPTKDRPSRAPLAPGAALWAECDRLHELHRQDQAKALEILAGRLRAAHMLPTGHKQVALLAPFRPLVERLLEQGVAEPTGAEVEAIARAARRAGDDLNRYLRITATADQSDIAIACKIIRKFGLAVARANLRRVGKARAWSYAVAAPALWGELVAARQRSLDAVTNLHKELFNKSVTTPSPGTLVKCLTTGAVALVEAVEGAIATLGDELGRCWQAPVDTLTPA